MGLIFIDIRSSRLKDLLYGLLEFFCIRIKDLDSKTVFMTCYRSCLEYFKTKPIVGLDSWVIESIGIPR